MRTEGWSGWSGGGPPERDLKPTGFPGGKGRGTTAWLTFPGGRTDISVYPYICRLAAGSEIRGGGLKVYAGHEGTVSG
jgi:hypothetical protein